MKFTDLNLDPKILQAIEACGYETPTPIQSKAIPNILAGIGGRGACRRCSADG